MVAIRFALHLHDGTRIFIRCREPHTAANVHAAACRLWSHKGDVSLYGFRGVGRWDDA